MLLHKQIIIFNFAPTMRRILFAILLLILCSACRTVQKEIIEVPVETVKTEYIHDTRIDSVYVRDSIDRWMSGDTVFIYKEHTKYKYLNKTDTLIKTDTIPKIIKTEVIKEVEVNRLKWYQKALMWLGGVLTLILTFYTIFKLKLK